MSISKNLTTLKKIQREKPMYWNCTEFSITIAKTKDLLKGQITVSNLTERDVHFALKQKGVDIKIGLDIASLAYKKQVKKIILVSGDSDFVPAAKLARREGIDFILDPIWNPIDKKLFEHIDGLYSTCPRPNRHQTA